VQVRRQFSALRLEAFHLISGDAKIVDDDRDGIAGRIGDGTRAAKLDLACATHRRRSCAR